MFLSSIKLMWLHWLPYMLWECSHHGRTFVPMLRLHFEQALCQWQTLDGLQAFNDRFKRIRLRLSTSKIVGRELNANLWFISLNGIEIEIKMVVSQLSASIKSSWGHRYIGVSVHCMRFSNLQSESQLLFSWHKLIDQYWSNKLEI